MKGGTHKDLVQVGSFTMAQMGQSKSVIGEFMKKKREVVIFFSPSIHLV